MFALAVASSACGRSEPEAPAGPRPAEVTLEAARTETLRDVVNAPGTIVTSTLGELLVVPPGPATLTEVTRKEGDVVAVGDVLARFDVAELTQEQQARELEQAEATTRVERARAAVREQTALYERGLTPRLALESLKTDLAAAEFAVTQANLQLRAAQANQTRSVITAPFAGVVAAVLHQPGDFVSGQQTDPVMRVIDPAKVQVLIQLPIAQFGRVAPGQKATIAPMGPGTTDEGLVFGKGAVAPNAPTGDVRLAFIAPTAQPLNAPVSVEILIDQRTDALLVPASAVLKDESTSFVFVVGADMIGHRRDVQVGLTARGLTQVTAGLTAGERVVTSGGDGLSEGAVVTVVR